MKSNKKLQILKIEGFPSQKYLSCSISQNSKQIKDFSLSSLLNEPIEVDYSSTTLLEIRIQSSSSLISGLNLNPALLKSSEQWVPLFPVHKILTLTSIPDDFSGSKVLLKTLNHSIPEENNESYESQPEAYESFASELVLASMIESPSIDSEELLGRTDLQVKCKKQSMIIKVLTKQLEVNNDKNTQLIKKTEILENKLNKTCEQLSSYMENASEREKSLIHTISLKDQEYQTSLNQILQSQAKLRSLENEKEHLSDQVNRLELELERLKDTEKELLQTNNKLQKSENLQDRLNKTLLKLSRSFTEDPDTQVSSNQLALKDAEIQMLKNIIEEVKKSADMQIFSLNQEITELKTVISKSQEQEKVLATKLIHVETDKSTNLVDSAFAEAMQRLRLSFKKLKEFVYEVQGKAVNVAVCRAGVMAKVGSSLLGLDEFFEEFLRASPKPEVCYTVMTDRTNEVDRLNRIQRVGSQKTFLKSTQSSQNKTRLGNDRTPSRTRVKSIERKPFR